MADCDCYLRVNDGGTNKFVTVDDGGTTKFVTYPGSYGWALCSGGGNVEYFSEANKPAQNFGWIYTGGAYAEARFNAVVCDQAATNPCFVGDPSGTPTQCSDVVPDYFTDEFSSDRGTCVWTARLTDGTTAVSGGNFVFTVDAYGGGSTKLLAEQSRGPIDGDVSVVTKVTMSSFLADNTVSQTAQLQIFTGPSTRIGYIGIQKAGAATNAQWKVVANDGSDHDVITNYTSDTIYLRFVRSGSTITMGYSSDGSSWTDVSSYTITSSATLYAELAMASRWTSNLVANWDYLRITT